MSMIECRTLFGEKILLPPERLIFRPSVYAIIRHEERVLLLNMRSTGKLFLPGGGSEIAERLEEALHREVREETGTDRSTATSRYSKPRRDYRPGTGR
jgi:8-oxo-dGTP pyrophosphatase MutT (NUDIX family)